MRASAEPGRRYRSAMTIRSARLGTVLSILLTVGCTNGTSTPAESADAPASLSAADRALLATEVDELLEMQSGGFAELGEFQSDDTLIIQARHVLRGSSPTHGS